MRVSGESIAVQICSDLKSHELDIKYIRGQRYDGALSMSSDCTGVQGRIRKESLLTVHTHCSGHCLNLVISHSSSIPIIRNVLDKMKASCFYFLKSPQKMSYYQILSLNHLLNLIKESSSLMCVRRARQRDILHINIFTSVMCSSSSH